MKSKISNMACYFVFIFCLILACKNDNPKLAAKYNCPDAGKFVKAIKAGYGIVTYDATAQSYAISAALPGTYDSVDFGYICSKNVFDFKSGDRVIFEGKYFEFPDKKQASFGGLAYYYLQIEKIKLR